MGERFWKYLDLEISVSCAGGFPLTSGGYNDLVLISAQCLKARQIVLGYNTNEPILCRNLPNEGYKLVEYCFHCVQTVGNVFERQAG